MDPIGREGFGRKRRRLGDILVEAGVITEEQLLQALEYQRQQPKKIRLGLALVQKGITTEIAIMEALKEQLHIESITLTGYEIPNDIIKMVSEPSMLKKYGMIPYAIDSENPNRLYVAMADPMDIVAMDDLGVVTGMEIVPAIATNTEIMSAIDLVRDQIHIPFVANMGGYEKPETIQMLKGTIDIFLTDVKYQSKEISKKYSSAPDYFGFAMDSLAEMISLCGAPKFDEEGIMQSGVIVRHLVLPGCRKDSFEVLKSLAERFGTEQFILSLMSQFTPNGQLEDYPELNRRITSLEYHSVVDMALELGFESAYMQQKSSAKEEYTPPFDLTGVV